MLTGKRKKRKLPSFLQMQQIQWRQRSGQIEMSRTNLRQLSQYLRVSIHDLDSICNQLREANDDYYQSMGGSPRCQVPKT